MGNVGLELLEVLEKGLGRVVSGTNQILDNHTAILLKAIEENGAGFLHDHGTCDDCARLSQESYSKGENPDMTQTVKCYKARSRASEGGHKAGSLVKRSF